MDDSRGDLAVSYQEATQWGGHGVPPLQTVPDGAFVGWPSVATPTSTSHCHYHGWATIIRALLSANTELEVRAL